MFKLLRKYNKLLLAIFGVLLMITFLIPQAIDQFSRQSGQRRAVVATVGDGENVTGDEWFTVQQELQFMQRVGISFPFLEATERLKPEHWYLLVREAEAAGLVGPQAISEDQLLSMAAMGQTRDLNFVRNTIAKIRGVNQLASLYQSGGMYSDRRLKLGAERLLHQVMTQVVVIQANDQGAPEPTEEEINAHFAKYADKEPGAGEDGFGYRLPDRVKLEWLHISPQSVRDAVERSDAFSTVAQRLHWRKFESDPTKNFPKVENGPVPEVVKQDLLGKLTAERMDEITRFAAEQLQLNRRGIPERDGYAVLPEDWNQRKLSFPDLAQAIQQRFNIDLPAYQAAGDRWLSIKEVGELEGIGTATTDKFGSSPLALPQLVEQTREIRNQGVTAVFVQKDVAGPPLKASDGSVYLFRIVDTQAAHTPGSVDEVREQVVKDLKRLANYRTLAASAPALEATAESEGLLALALQHDTQVQRTATLSMANRYMLMQFVQAGMRPMLMPSSLPVIGADKQTVQAIVDYALTLPRNVKVESLAEEQRVLAMPVPSKQAVIVLRIVRQDPLSQEDFAQLVQMGAIQQLLTSEDLQQEQNLKAAFSLEALAKRNNFSYRGMSGEDEGQPSNDPVQSASTAG